MSKNNPLHPGAEYIAHIKENFILCVGDITERKYAEIYSKKKRRFVGTVSHDTPGHDGYRRLKVRLGNDVKMFKYHHVVFLLYHGRWPAMQLDHIDDDPLNNHPLNHKEVTDIENQRKMQRRKQAIKNYYENRRAMADYDFGPEVVETGEEQAAAAYAAIPY